MAYTNAQATPRSDVHSLMMQAGADFNSLCIGEQVLPVKGEDVKRGIYMKAALASTASSKPTPSTPKNTVWNP